MSATKEFFRSRRPQAAFKHGILKRYPVVFASKTGWGGRPVVFLDGYAGRGEYDDGTPGSPKLLAEHAAKVDSFRQVTGIFVEKSPKDYRNLKEVLAPFNRPNDQVLCGDIRDHLPAILETARGAALFAFLDPFGPALDRAQLVDGLMGRQGGAPTEVLLHISVSTVARIGGLLRRRHLEGKPLSTADQKTITRADLFLGGAWWQELFEPATDADKEKQATEAALRVAAKYQADVCREARCRAVSMPIQARPTQLPKYILVLFTRHVDGLWYFADALGKAGREWHGAWRDHQNLDLRAKIESKQPDVPGLFDLDVALPHVEKFDPVEYEAANRVVWTQAIEANITARLGGHGPFSPAEHVNWVYGELLGAASERHVRAAVRSLHQKGVITNTGKEKNFHRARLQPAARGAAATSLGY